MFEILQSDTFRRWHAGLKDRQAVMRVNARIRRLADGNPGDVKAVGRGISELRIDYGPGYRLYYMQRGAVVVVLLAGGDKRTQSVDIDRARSIAAEWKE
ncbi:MAG TPA: type II toxin-antitoxin system RelE/ParE family toxin [Luteibacter sp.]|jgi:putative addiction module killer protein|nr:type II toxin-antitoxin system RelE/ParE family toxin [Luteibacter sp.]